MILGRKGVKIHMIRLNLYYLKRGIYILLLLTLINICLLNNQNAIEKPRIVLSMQVNTTKVPLNRTLELKVIVKWGDEPNRYEVIRFGEPTLVNFKIIGSAVSSHSEVSGGRTDIIKECIYTLKPQSLGMGYVEGVEVKVRDNVDGAVERLETQRISIEIIDPIPEGTKLTRKGLYIVLGVIVALGAIGIGLLLYRGKKYKERQELIAIPEPMEKTYLGKLKKTFNLQHPNLRDDFFALSKLLRHYLEEKFSIPALGLTTEEINASLEKLPLDENQINNIKRILTRSDEIKFSGNEGTYEEINQFYTLFESLLEKFCYEAEQKYKRINENEEKKI